MVYTAVHYENDGGKTVALALGVHVGTVRHYASDMGIKSSYNRPTTIEEDRVLIKARDEKRETGKKYKQLLEENERILAENEAILKIAGSSPRSKIIQPKRDGGKGQGIANALLSDIHMEEDVHPEEVEGMNEYNLKISLARMEEYFQTVLRFVELEQNATQIDHLVLWLLGDNITGWLHEENIFSTSLAPVDAALLARDHLFRGISFLLENSELHLTIPCVVGN